MKKTRKKRDLAIRFWEKVNKTETCWLWTAYVNPEGYGKFFYKGGPERAHRVAWELTYGPIPEGKCILHKCDNPPCVNPEHLFLGTRTDNAVDKITKGRQGGPRGERSASAVLTESQIIEMRRLKGSMTVRAISKQFGISESHASRVLSGKKWKHLNAL